MKGGMDIMSFVIFFIALGGLLGLIGCIYVYGWLTVIKITIAVSLIYTAGTLYRLKDKTPSSSNKNE